MSEQGEQDWTGSSWADRLEHVRERAGIDSLRALWRVVTSGDDEPVVSYDAVRTYHLQDREPPPPYLVRVAKRLGVRLEWLMTGEGAVMSADVKTEEESAVGRDLRGLPHMAHLPLMVSAALAHHMSERDAARWRDQDAEPLADTGAEARQVWGEIISPLKGRTPLDWPAFTNYVMAAIHVRNLALRITTTEED